MRKTSYMGRGLMLIGLIGMAGAIDTDKGWEVSIALMGIGVCICLITTIKQFLGEIYEDYKGYTEYRSSKRSISHDASYPSYLRR